MDLLKNKLLISLVVGTMLFSSVSAASISSIEAVDNNTIEITASEDVMFSDISVEGDVKLLKDIPVSFSAVDPEDATKLMINLGTDLNANTSYSLISIIGADGNIDFSIGEYLEGEIANSNVEEGERGISKINVVDSRTIELYFTYELEEDSFEFKILSEIKTSGISSMGDNKLSLEVARALESSTNYIIMVLSLEDAGGMDVTFDEDLHDFVTPMELPIDAPQEQNEIAKVEEDEPEPVQEGNIEEVALNSAATPETGTATGLLIMFALFVNIAIFARKKFNK